MKANLKKTIPWIVLSLLMISLAVWYFLGRRVTQDQLVQYTNIMTEANTFLEAKQYSVAIKRYQDASEVIPTKVDAYDGIVRILLLKNRVNDATEIVKKSANALGLNDKSILYERIGDYYYAMGDYESAKDMYQNALGLGIDNLNVEFMLGKTLLHLGKVDEAKGQLEKDGYSEDIDSEARLLLGYIESTKNSENAKNILSSIVPTQKLLPYYEEIIEVLESLDDDSKYNATKLARVYINNGYSYLALTLLEAKADEFNEYLEGLYFLGRAYLDVGQYDKSLEILDKALTLGGFESEIFWYKARASLLKNDLDNAIKSYQRAVDYAGKSLPDDLLKEYVDILVENKQNLKAEDFLSNILEIKGNPYILLLTLQVEYDLEDTQKVDYYISQLSKKDLTEEEEMKYIYWKVKVMLDNGEDDGIQELLDQLLALSKYNSQYYLLKGRYDLFLNNKEEAKSSLEKSLEYDLNNLVAEEASSLLSNIK